MYKTARKKFGKTKRNMKKFERRRIERGLANALKKEWRNTHPYAQAGFALIATAVMTLGTAVATVGVYKAYEVYNTYMDNKETPVVEEYRPRSNNNVFDRHENDLKRFLD